ncbi:MAG: alanine/glycine:cation symporter family protein [Chitinophagales bacterium]|nr:alanine:cation symporter family protein [Sphingobacteriales bacterium]
MKWPYQILISLLLAPCAASASNSVEENIDRAVQPIVEALSCVIFYKPFASFGFDIKIVVLWLIIGAIFFTVYFRFINIRLFKHAIDITRGLYDKKGAKGEVSHFQALVTALSGTVGLGNISGVAVAISLGGAGATFWMIMAGLLGMTSKFVECTLGVKYRHIDSKGEVSGGPMYYLSLGLAKHNKAKLGKILAILFAILCVGGSIGGGNMFQSNQCYAQIANVFPQFANNGFAFGVLLAIFVGVVIIGGIKKIANVTDKLVPLMVAIYLIFGLIIIGKNIFQLDEAILKILTGAFNIKAIFGGAAGAIAVGFQRAAFSNEAGVGSAAIAHSAVKTDQPLTEGIVSLLEPFIDTVVICTMTALIIIFTGFDTADSSLTGSQLTSAAFSSVLPWFKYVLTISILFFAYSTMISWSYYGLKAWTFLFGETKKMKMTYNLIYLSFVVVGSSASLANVMEFSDMMILAMAFPNILGLYILAPEIKKDLNSYLSNLKQAN